MFPFKAKRFDSEPLSCSLGADSCGGWKGLVIG